MNISHSHPIYLPSLGLYYTFVELGQCLQEIVKNGWFYLPFWVNKAANRGIVLLDAGMHQHDDN